MKVYIASHHPDLANYLANELIAVGHQIVSTWHTNNEPRPAADDRAVWAKAAEENFSTIVEADALVLISGPDKYAGGKFVEAGFAIAAGVPVLVFGRIENGMLYHPLACHCPMIADVKKHLQEMQTFSSPVT